MPVLIQIDRIALTDVQVATLRASAVTMIQTMSEPARDLDPTTQLLIDGYVRHAAEILAMIDAR